MRRADRALSDAATVPVERAQGQFRIVQAVREFSTAGGAEAVAFELQRAWGRAGVPSRVLASCCDELVRPDVELVARWSGHVATRGRWRYAGRLVAVPAYTLAATTALRAHRDAAILSHGDTLTGDVIVIHAVDRASLAEKRRAGHYGWLLNPMHGWVLARDRWMIGGLRFRRYVAVSRRVGQEIADHYGVPQSRIALIPNGINLERFSGNTGGRASVRREFGIPMDASLLLLVSHEFDRKGLAYVIRAMKHLSPDVYLLVVGSDARESYEELARSLDLGGRVVFAGARRDMPAIYDASDAFVFPTAYESFSLVCMEAMACGVPVLATRAGGIEDYLRDGVNGFFVTRDPENIATRLSQVLNDPALRARLGDGARETAQHYAWSNIAAQYRDLLHETWLEKRAAAARPVTGWPRIDAPARRIAKLRG